MTYIRRAETWEAELLTDIAFRSEAYWGYDSAFMDNFKSLYNVTEDFISNNETFVIEENKSIQGFYGLTLNDGENSLEYLYIEPQAIGKGYGKLLWNHLVNTCKRQGIKEIVFVTSPQAKEFYTKMGAIQIGEVNSLVIIDRKIPKLVYKLES